MKSEKKVSKTAQTKASAKKVVIRPAAKTTTRSVKNADTKAQKTVIAQEKVQTAEGWKRAMLLERKLAEAKKS